MSEFYGGNDVFCPSCPPVMGGKDGTVRRGVRLECTEHNYSGCGVDMGNCPKCGKGYQISFVVGAVKRAEEWDVDPKE